MTGTRYQPEIKNVSEKKEKKVKIVKSDKNKNAKTHLYLWCQLYNVVSLPRSWFSKLGHSVVMGFMSAKSTSPARDSDNIVTCVASKLSQVDDNPFDARHSETYTDLATTTISFLRLQKMH